MNNKTGPDRRFCLYLCSTPHCACSNLQAIQVRTGKSLFALIITSSSFKIKVVYISLSLFFSFFFTQPWQTLILLSLLIPSSNMLPLGPVILLSFLLILGFWFWLLILNNFGFWTLDRDCGCGCLDWSLDLAFRFGWGLIWILNTTFILVTGRGWFVWVTL